MKALRLPVLLMFLILGCDEESTKVKKSGYFNLSQLKSPTANGRAAESAEDVFLTEFDLGDLKASKEFYFLLSNGGENPITNITLETDDPRFTISPKTINKLGGPDNSDFIPLISLGVIHGLHLNGFGFTDILDAGENRISLKIKGTTVENGASISVESEFIIKVNSKVMDIELFDNGTLVDLFSPQTTTSGVVDVGGLGAVPGYIFQSNKVKLKNTGNVDIKVGVKSWIENVSSIEVEVAPNQTTELTLTVDPNTGDKTVLISLNGNGTIADYQKIKLGNDGKGHFFIH